MEIMDIIRVAMDWEKMKHEITSSKNRSLRKSTDNLIKDKIN